jgi:hypothetical protein
MITAECDVEWSDAKREGTGVPKRYVVLVAAPYHTTQRDHVILRRPEQKAVPLTLAVPGSPKQQPSNLPITIQLWTWREAPDVGGECMYRAAHVVTTLEVLAKVDAHTRLQMVNVDGYAQAYMNLRRIDVTAKLGPPDPAWSDLKLPARMTKDQMAAGLEANGKVPRRFLRDHVPHMYGEVPVWMLCQMYTGGELDTRITEGYLRNALHHSVRLLGYADERAWMASRGAPLYFEVLAKVCTFHVQWGTYLFDETWKPGNGFVGNDQFSVIEAAPDLKSASGDCEDDALSITLTAMRLHQMRFAAFKRGDPLRELIRLAHGYCCLTADVSINPDGLKLPAEVQQDDPGVLSLHHLAMLVPWCRMDRLVAGGRNVNSFLAAMRRSKGAWFKATARWPTLSIEGTSACRANVRSDTTALDAFYKHVRDVRRENGLAVMRRCHIDVSMKEFDRGRFYRQIIAFYSPDLYRLFGVAMMLACDGGKFGAEWKAWVLDSASGDFSLTATKFASDAEDATIVQLCRRTPKLAALDAPLSSRIDYPLSAAQRRAGVQYLVFRDGDITEAQAKAMVDAFRVAGTYKLVAIQRIVMAANSIVVAYLFVPIGR